MSDADRPSIELHPHAVLGYLLCVYVRPRDAHILHDQPTDLHLLRLWRCRSRVSTQARCWKLLMACTGSSWYWL